MHAQFTTLRTADILDALVEAVDIARVKAGNDSRWQNAIDAGYDYLLTHDEIQFDVESHAIRVESATEAGKVYIANGDCSCQAFQKSQACWHRAAARLVRRALELAAGTPQAEPVRDTSVNLGLRVAVSIGAAFERQKARLGITQQQVYDLMIVVGQIVEHEIPTVRFVEAA